MSGVGRGKSRFSKKAKERFDSNFSSINWGIEDKTQKQAKIDELDAPKYEKEFLKKADEEKSSNKRGI